MTSTNSSTELLPDQMYQSIRRVGMSTSRARLVKSDGQEIKDVKGGMHLLNEGLACKTYGNYRLSIGQIVIDDTTYCGTELRYGSNTECGYYKLDIYEEDLTKFNVYFFPLEGSTFYCSQYDNGKVGDTYRVESIIFSNQGYAPNVRSNIDGNFWKKGQTPPNCDEWNTKCIPDPNRDKAVPITYRFSRLKTPDGSVLKCYSDVGCTIEISGYPNGTTCVDVGGTKTNIRDAAIKINYGAIRGRFTCTPDVPANVTLWQDNSNPAFLSSLEYPDNSRLNCRREVDNSTILFKEGAFYFQPMLYDYKDSFVQNGKLSAVLPHCYPRDPITTANPSSSSSLPPSSSITSRNPQYITTTDNNAASSLSMSNPFSVSSNYGAEFVGGFRDGALSGAAMALVPSSMQSYVGPAMMLFNYKTGIMSMVNWATGEAVNVVLDEASSKEFKEAHGDKVKFAARLATSAAIGGVYGVGAALGGEVAGLAAKELPNLADKAGEVISSVAVNGTKTVKEAAKTSQALARKHVIGYPGYGGSQATGLLGTGINFMLKGFDSVAGGVNALRDTGDGLYNSAKDQATAARSHISSKWRDFAERARVAAGGIAGHGF